MMRCRDKAGGGIVGGGNDAQSQSHCVDSSKVPQLTAEINIKVLCVKQKFGVLKFCLIRSKNMLAVFLKT